MKIRKVTANNRRKAFEVSTASNVFPFPYAICRPEPTAEDPVERVYPDPDAGREAFTYVLGSGAEGTIHIDHVLEYNRDPGYLKDQTLYKLTLAARERVEKSDLSTREIIRRLGTSASQFYRLLDQTNHRKSIGQLLALLELLDCEVDSEESDPFTAPDQGHCGEEDFAAGSLAVREADISGTGLEEQRRGGRFAPRLRPCF